MRNKVYDGIKIFALQVYTEKVEYPDVTEYIEQYEENTMVCPGVIIDGMCINLFTLEIYPLLSELNDYVMLHTVYVTNIYNYGDKIETDTGYYMINLEVEEAIKYYNRALDFASSIKTMENKNILWYQKGRAKVLQKRLDR